MSSGMLPLYICPCDIFPASGLLGEKTVLARADKVTAADFHIVPWLACALWGASSVAVEDLKSCFFESRNSSSPPLPTNLGDEHQNRLPHHKRIMLPSCYERKHP